MAGNLFTINNPTFSAILGRLGIAQAFPFSLLDIVVPVSLVDSGISITTTTTPPIFGSPSSIGESTAPIAGTRLADTGILTAGNWYILVTITAGENVPFRIRRRNAADAGDIFSIRYAYGTLTSPLTILEGAFSVAANERFVVENVAAGNAGIVYQAAIFATLLP